MAEAVDLDLPRDLLSALGLNCCRFCNSCLGAQFPLLEHILDVPGNDRLVPLEQVRQFPAPFEGGVFDDGFVDAHTQLLGGD